MKRTLISHKDNLRSEFVTEDEKMVMHTVQDVSKTLNYVKQLEEQKPGKDLRHVAEVPLVIYEKAKLEGWADDPKAWKKWLNAPENKPFRTWKGKV